MEANERDAFYFIKHYGSTGSTCEGYLTFCNHRGLYIALGSGHLLESTNYLKKTWFPLSHPWSLGNRTNPAFLRYSSLQSLHLAQVGTRTLSGAILSVCVWVCLCYCGPNDSSQCKFTK